MSPSFFKNQTRRDGATLIAVLVGLSVATLIVLTTLQSSLRLRRQLSRELQMEQTRWLMEAGVGRAIQTGAGVIELKPPLATFGESSIKITSIETANNAQLKNNKERWRITATIYPKTKTKTTVSRTRRQIEIEIPSNAKNESNANQTTGE